ncbi:cell wall-binding repeat-containing protein [Romboutsia timonensis]|uniref:cell wall-binding repeat-containing protein n=1 Tax=Romboutsia timonensis TaxID=1776391 RepID=UPI000AA0D9FC|nr:cell wall-binding repeat-containing protein [Romboutsia timonensis]
MKKKNMAMIMAGVTVATSVAPAFAAGQNEVKEDKNYKLNAKDTAKLVEEVRNALEVKFQDTKLGVTVGERVYSITVDKQELVNATQLQNKINGLADGATLNVAIFDKGHQVINGKIANYEFKQYETAAEIVADVEEANLSATTKLSATIKSTDTVEVKKDEEVVVVKVGDNRLDFTAPKMQNNKLVGFETKAFDIENGETHTVTIKKTDAVMTSVKVDTLYDGMRLTSDGKKLVEAYKELKNINKASIDENSVTIAPGFSGEASFEIHIKDIKTDKESQIITISGSNELVLRLEGLLSNDPELKGNIDVLAGDSRFETAIEVSKATFKDAGDAKSVILVGQDAVVDGLAAAPLAAEKNAPILLAKKDGVTEEVEAEMLRVLGTNLTGKTIYIIGGESQISKEAEAKLAKLGVKVKRLAGASRYETSLKIAEELNSTSKTSFVVGGNGEVDAMSIAAYAAQTKSPIIVTNKDVVSEETTKVLEGKQIEIIGGTSSVSAAVEAELAKIDMDKKVVRLAGTDRKGTNAKVINRYYGNAKEVFVAKDGHGTGVSHLIDALTAAPLAGSKNAPIILATNSVSTEQVETAELKLKNVTKITQIGQGIANTVVEKLYDVLNLLNK